MTRRLQDFQHELDEHIAKRFPSWVARGEIGRECTVTKWCKEGQLTETMQVSNMMRESRGKAQSILPIAWPDISKQSIREQICQLLGKWPPQAKR